MSGCQSDIGGAEWRSLSVSVSVSVPCSLIRRGFCVHAHRTDTDRLVSP